MNTGDPYLKRENMISFSQIRKSELQIIEFFIKVPFNPKELRSISPPNPITENFSHKGVVLSGRGPIWLYGFLIHFYHPTKFVATYDPRLKGAVVVETHVSDHQVGDIIPIDLKDVS